jgi:integrase
MSDPHPTAPAKPAKPYPDFPLFPHATKRWAKKVRGKLHYFGPWDDSPDRGAGAALDRYNAQAADLHAGRAPRPAAEDFTVRDLAEDFLTAKQALLDAGELSPRTWADYKEVCDTLVSRFGKNRLASDVGPADFAGLREAMAKRWGAHRLGKLVQYVRCAFRFAYDSGTLDRPARFGPGFKRPSKKTLRLNRAAKGKQLFTPGELRSLLAVAWVPMKAMVLLGINCGFGPTDCGRLPLSAVDLDAGMIDFPRPKTGIARRCPLWPETVAALREALARRPEPKDPADAALVFVTKQGQSWAGGVAGRPVTQEFHRLLKKAGLNGGRGFYALRHSHRTVADEARDQPAADYVMGHEVPHMSSIYRETISDARLRAVADHVHSWLFGAAGAEGPAGLGAAGAGG